MGGRAFPNLDLVRIKREHIQPTIEQVVDTLQYPQFTLDYALNHMMGSAGKQADSGDLDFALHDVPAKFYGERSVHFNIKHFAQHCETKLPSGRIITKTLPGGQFQTAWPVVGGEGLVQVDFIAGDVDWLLFTHFSPGLEASAYKGVMISTLFAVMAKMVDSFAFQDGNGNTVAKVEWNYDLEQGVYRRWSYLREGDTYFKTMNPDLLESKFKDFPRFSRTGYLTDPLEVLDLLYGKPVDRGQVDSFEKAVGLAQELRPQFFPELKDRLISALLRSNAKHDFTREQLNSLPVWQ